MADSTRPAGTSASEACSPVLETGPDGQPAWSVPVAPEVSSDVLESSAALFAEYHTKIRRFVLGMLRDGDEADDVTQEVFLRAHRNLASLRDPNALIPWLYRIATHACYDRFRAQGRHPAREPLDADGIDVDLLLTAETPRLEQLIEKAEMSACIRSYLERLSDGYRQVILLHEVDELTNREIAEMLGISVDAVKIRLHRARRRLQLALEGGCDFSRDEDSVLVCEPAPPTGDGRP